MLALFIVAFYLIYTAETVRTKSLDASLKLPIICITLGYFIYLVNSQISIAYLLGISIASLIFIFKKASRMEDIELYYKRK
jgi:hypothetical protein